MRIAYFDCFSGISGDMILGALIDLGVSPDVVLGQLQKLPLGGYTFETRKESRGAIGGTRVIMEVEPQPHRTFQDIRRILQSSALDRWVQEKSLEIFERLARAESRVHQVPVSEVHFHEVGALDAILDVVGSVAALHHLKIERLCASKIPLGRGLVKSQHGLLPVPAPATVLLLEGVPVYDNGIERELVTPTGAAILTTLAHSFGPVPDMTLQATGYGVGTHPASDPPNVLRVLYGTRHVALQPKDLLLLETNIDDMNPEFFDYIFERLFSSGALDVSLTATQMKKNRPGTLLRVLVEPAAQAEILEILLSESTTLGVRIHEVKRVELPRRVEEIETQYGSCRVKRIVLPDGKIRTSPEYEDCKRIARRHRIPIGRVYEEVLMLSRNMDSDVN